MNASRVAVTHATPARLARRGSGARVRGELGARTSLLVVAVYAVSRFGYHAMGIEPDLSTLGYFWQYLDVELLREDLWRSVWYDHAQPPLYNAWLGAHLQLADATGLTRAVVFQTGIWAVGLASQLLLFALTQRLGATRRVAFVAVVLWCVHPASILYDHFVFYSAPIATLVLAMLVSGHRALATGRRRDLFACLLFAALVVLGRSLFHLVWWVAVALTLVWFAPSRRRALACALVPFALATLPFAKNLAYYDAPASSSWLGMSLAKLAVVEMPTTVRERLHEEGRVSGLVHLPPFAPLRTYPEKWRELPPGTPDHPSVRNPEKRNGQPNYHHAAYVPIAAQYLADARELLTTHPGAYRRNVESAVEIFWKSTTSYSFLLSNRQRLEPLDQLFDAAWGIPQAIVPEEHRRAWGRDPRQEVAWLWFVLVLGVAVWGSWRIFAPGRGSRRVDRALRGTLALALGTVLYVMVVSCLVEVGENNRFRMLIEPSLLALVAAGLSRAARRVRARGRAPTPPTALP